MDDLSDPCVFDLCMYSISVCIQGIAYTLYISFNEYLKDFHKKLSTFNLKNQTHFKFKTKIK